MDNSVNDVLELDDKSFNDLPMVIKLMELKEGSTKIIRLVYCKTINTEIVVESFYKPISKMLEHED